MQVVVASYDRVYPAADDAVGDVEDNCKCLCCSSVAQSCDHVQLPAFKV